ncbi:MAG: hypothetical protein Q8O00_14475 [Holophaga sp.]|nr:hypothetical protein [Holophaga sp.]
MIIQVPADTSYSQDLEDLFYIQTERDADLRLFTAREGVLMKFLKVETPLPSQESYGEAWAYQGPNMRGELIVWITSNTHRILNIRSGEPEWRWTRCKHKHLSPGVPKGFSGKLK